LCCTVRTSSAITAIGERSIACIISHGSDRTLNWSNGLCQTVMAGRANITSYSIIWTSFCCSQGAEPTSIALTDNAILSRLVARISSGARRALLLRLALCTICERPDHTFILIVVRGVFRTVVAFWTLNRRANFSDRTMGVFVAEVTGLAWLALPLSQLILVRSR
jgi:hypothetical protein